MFGVPYRHVHHNRYDLKPGISLHTAVRENLLHGVYTFQRDHLGVRPWRELVHLKVVSVLSLLSPPWGASTSPFTNPRYSVKATVTSSTALPALFTRSRKCVLLTFSCLHTHTVESSGVR